uniref:WAP domain-containing protein n=1 Tax=Knipowitschia caucasica TaxID=637954 RepID=A0AAV2LXY8_KNICA
MELSVLCLLTLALAFVPQLSATAVPIPRPGCPPYKYLSPQELSVRLCLKECSTDRDCKDNKICCFDGCSNVCVPRSTGPKPGSCPVPGFGICVNHCYNDHQCAGNLKCCSNGCGKTCVAPVKEVPIPRPGCPPYKYLSPQELSVRLCLKECSTDRDCKDNKICCFDGCSNVCVPRSTGPKPGSCPVPGFGICVNHCYNDHQCDGNLKCCSNGCGKTCVAPVKEVKVGCCPAPFQPQHCHRDDKCKQDNDCDDGEKCCFDGCENTCRKPLEKKKGVCPEPIPHLTTSPDECSADNQCEGGLKCCYSGAAMQCTCPKGAK